MLASLGLRPENSHLLLVTDRESLMCTRYVPTSAQRALMGLEHNVVLGELGVTRISRLRAWTGIVGEGRSANQGHRQRGEQQGCDYFPPHVISPPFLESPTSGFIRRMPIYGLETNGI